MKMIFHAILRQNKEVVCSLKKINKLLSISKDVLFEERLQNYQYKVIRAGNSVCKLTIADFPLMNLNNLITLAYMIKSLDDKYVTEKKRFI